MPIGTAMTTVLPTVGVDTDADGQAAVLDRLTECQEYLEARLGNDSLALGTDPDVFHGTRVQNIPGSAGLATVGSLTAPAIATPYWVASGGTDEVCFPICLDVHQRIKAVSMYGRANGATAWTFKLWKIDMSVGSATQIGSTQTSAITLAISNLSVGSLTETIASGVYYVAVFTAGASGNRTYGCTVSYDRVQA